MYNLFDADTCWAKIREIHPDTSVSSTRLQVLSRCYTNLYSCKFTQKQCLGDDGASLKEEMQQLALVLETKIKQLPLGEECFRLLSSLYSLVYIASLPVDCDALAEQLFAGYLASEDREGDYSCETAVCLCLTDYYYLNQPDEADTAWYNYLYDTAERWIGELDGQGEWGTLNDEAALRQLEVLIRISYMLVDDSYDDDIRRIFRRYADKLMHKETASIAELGILYESAIHFELHTNQDDWTEKLMEQITAIGNRYPADSEAYLECLSYYSMFVCEKSFC